MDGRFVDVSMSKVESLAFASDDDKEPMFSSSEWCLRGIVDIACARSLIGRENYQKVKEYHLDCFKMVIPEFASSHKFRGVGGATESHICVFDSGRSEQEARSFESANN